VRPTDENQPSSTRPPFMSATRRPASTEDNILARMERDSRRGGAGSSWKRSWIAWCSVASLAIIGLIGVLASLARENIEVHQPAPLAESKAAPDPYGAAPLMAGAYDGFAPLPPPSAMPSPVQPKLPATAVDMRPARTPARADEAARPSLVMLKPPPTPVKAVAARPAASAPHKSAPVAALKPAPVAALKPAPARALVASVPRPRKPLPAPAAASALEPAVDSDVALLSAIIMHASRHAGERAQLEAARCGAGRKCAPAPGPDPLTSLKATD
jgi:hypothetical protein